MQNYILDIRPRRQATFPSSLLNNLGLEVGDSFEAKIVDDTIILKPRKKIALDSLKEIQSIFKDSKVSEKDVQKSIDLYRH